MCSKKKCFCYLIVGKLTTILDGSLDPKIATLLMKELKGINKKYNTSIVVLAHVPKQNGKLHMTENTMASSAITSHHVVERH